MGAPCKGCQNRHIGCHTECGLYAEFKAKSEEERNCRLAVQKPYHDAHAFRGEMILKLYKKDRSRRT